MLTDLTLYMFYTAGPTILLRFEFQRSIGGYSV